MKNQKSILGIGNALVDILVRLNDDKMLEAYSLPKGSMTYVKAEVSQSILDSTSNLSRSIETGGSAANTMRAIGQLNGKGGYIGKICDDEMGRFFRSELEKFAITPHLIYSGNPTGKATTLISPDSERTFATYLGAASELTTEEVHDVFFETYDYLHVEGYLVFNHELIEGILKSAKQAGLKISLDLASFNVVEEDYDLLKHLIKNYTDIIFANEEEAFSYTGLNPEEAVKEIAKECDIAVVKAGRKGSLICSKDKVIKVETPQVESIDTTGAGDVYAAGFLYGLANGFGLHACGRLGSLLASKVIQTLGARIPNECLPGIFAEVENMRP